MRPQCVPYVPCPQGFGKLSLLPVLEAQAFFTLTDEAHREGTVQLGEQHWPGLTWSEQKARAGDADTQEGGAYVTHLVAFG